MNAMTITIISPLPFLIMTQDKFPKELMKFGVMLPLL